MKRTFASDGQELLDGLKRITLENWQIPDLPRMFEITEGEWAKILLVPQLSANVPEDVLKVFEVARGSMLYGWYYYPLITLASEQLLRVLELAARKRCEQTDIRTERSSCQNGKVRPKTFSDRISTLSGCGIISASDMPRWESARKLRNDRSHPKNLMIITPGMACANLEISCELINKIFQ